MGRLQDLGPMRAVVLVEEEIRPSAAPVFRTVVGRWAGWAAHHAAWATAITGAVAVVLLVVAVGAPRWAIARERLGLMAPVEVVGAVRPQPSPPAVGWMVEAPWAPGAVLAGDTVALYAVDPEQTSISGVDLLTGVVRWTGALAAVDAGSERRCFPLASNGPDGPAVACVAVRDGSRVQRRPAPGPVMVVDAQDGVAISRRRAPGAVGGVALVDQDLLLAVSTDLGLDLVREDARTGDVRWRAPLVRSSSSALVPSQATVIERAGVVLVGVGGTVMVLDGATGQVLEVPRAGVEHADVVVLLHDGAVVAGSYGTGEAALQLRSTVRRVDGRGLVVVTGLVTEPLVSDRPGEVLYTWSAVPGGPFGGRVRAVSRLTGEQVWRSPGPSAGVLVELSGVVVLHGAGHVMGVDAVSGRQLWRRPVTILSSEVPFTDGVRLLLVRAEPGVGTVLEAMRLHDGATEWVAALPVGVTRVVQLGSHLVGLGPGVAVALR